MSLRWIVGGSYTIQAAPELLERPSPREDLHPTVANLQALRDGSERDPVFSVPPHDPEAHQPPSEIRLYAIPAGEILPLPGADGANVIASPHVYSSAAVPVDPNGVPEIRIQAPEIQADRYIALIVYGFAD